MRKRNFRNQSDEVALRLPHEEGLTEEKCMTVLSEELTEEKCLIMLWEGLTEERCLVMLRASATLCHASRAALNMADGTLCGGRTNMAGGGTNMAGGGVCLAHAGQGKYCGLNGEDEGGGRRPREAGA